jgi:glutamate/tyrosine decarboxylase-like PLP-dependent enzyme
MSTAPTERPHGCASRGRAALAGIELADSLVLDAHKWLFQPMKRSVLQPNAGEHRDRTRASRKNPSAASRW